MSDPFVGEIRMFAGNFAPRGWAFCDGQLLDVSQNDELFSLLGKTYGGDGQSTFALPDLRGRTPIHAGQGPGLSSRKLGTPGGSEYPSLTADQLPSHGHTWHATSSEAANLGPVASPDSIAYAVSTHVDIYSDTISNHTPMQGTVVGNAGGSKGHNNLKPFMCVNFIIALAGLYPSRN